MKLLPTFEGATAAATRYTIPLLLRSSAHYYILYLSKLRWLPRSAIYHNDSGRRRRRRSLQNGRREAFLIPSPFRRRWGIKYSRSRKTIPFRFPPPKRATIQTFFLPLPLHLYPSRSPDTSNIFAIFRNRAEDKTWLGKNNILASPYLPSSAPISVHTRSDMIFLAQKLEMDRKILPVFRFATFPVTLPARKTSE